ncbi:all trans-polyprenyl-diphosphate synthase PDSS2-like [Phymastichus coffea]|uniref:all trans-polyprenyl-diphosphate synthase PDSS2-like n=1 Tax=Phymastichus coffea TaxID=108790 RepID=UPI00273CCC34|nr:all trans-polyprenyl-diphosphate synthase PDSS2-like [Phymastichus coffea]
MSANKSVTFFIHRSKILSSTLGNQSTLFYVDREAVNFNFKKYTTETVNNPNPDWSKVVSQAEKIVGYPTSFLSLRWLLSDEIANIALHLQKLAGSNHPLLQTAKNLIYNGHNMQAWGLIVLLISKAAGHVNIDDINVDKSAGILHSQWRLAKITEMIRTSHLVHRSLVNVRSGEYSEQSKLNDINFGNKIALLSGDYLLGSSGAELAALRNQELLELIISTIKDFAESEFVGRRDNQDHPLPSVPQAVRTGYAEQEWTLRNVLSSGALLGKSCKGTLKLAGHNEEMLEQGYIFGKHLALAWQACLDLSPFISRDKKNQFDVCSAPVMFHIEHDPSILIEIDKGLESIQNIDYVKVYDIVASGPGIELTKQLQRKHSHCAMEALNVFREGDARTALSNLITAMGDS